MERKRTLLEKYEIPLNHLDFVYIGECNDAREIEKIVQILRSGEEGHFPDLTKCAEERLRVLKPNSRLFRYEEQLRSRDSLTKQEWQPIYDWTNDIKLKDDKLLAALETQLDLAPMRKCGNIERRIPDDNKAGESSSTAAGCSPTKDNKPAERIKSTDYNKWDKYDADEECLRMDLASERVQEEVERKNRLNLQKSQMLQSNVNQMQYSGDKERELWSKLTEVERDKLSEDYRLRGNECFRAKEYENAVREYSRVINMNPDTATAAYNNRAAAKIKLQKFDEAIEDCQRCLKLEPDNFKARLRLAEATYASGRRRESYDLYTKVLEIDAQNVVALKAIGQLRTIFGELPPASATRLQIHENKTKSSTISIKSTEQKQKQQSAATTSGAMKSKPKGATTSTTKANSNSKSKPKQEYDLADLVVPNRVIKNKFASAAEAFSNLKLNDTQKEQQQQQPKGLQQQPPKKEIGTPMSSASQQSSMSSELRLPTAMGNIRRRTGRMLIEEI